jgi:hypothetical protein
MKTPESAPSSRFPLIIEIRFPEDQLERLAELISSKLSGHLTKGGKPLSVSEAAERLSWSRNTVYRRIEAGLVKTVPNAPRAMIPASEIKRLLDGL